VNSAVKLTPLDSLIVVADGTMLRSFGATLFTVTRNDCVSLPPSPSDTVTVTAYTPSSAYVCLPPITPEPFAKRIDPLSIGEPSPQSIVAS
jgi:hypothetical protein